MKAEFRSPLRLEDIDGTEGVLLEPLRFYSAFWKTEWHAPAGFVTDFASIPRGLWNVFPKRGKHDRAAVLHDAAYRGVLRNAQDVRVHLVKDYADALFLEALRACGVNRVSARLMFWAVSMFGDPKHELVETVD